LENRQFWFLAKKKKNQRTSGPGYFENLRELGVFHEITGNETSGFISGSLIFSKILRTVALYQDWAFHSLGNCGYES
jgi:hypothetical protein